MKTLAGMILAAVLLASAGGFTSAPSAHPGVTAAVKAGVAGKHKHHKHHRHHKHHKGAAA